MGILLQYAVTAALLYLYLFSEHPPSGIVGFLGTYAVIWLVVAFNRWEDRRVRRTHNPD